MYIRNYGSATDDRPRTCLHGSPEPMRDCASKSGGQHAARQRPEACRRLIGEVHHGSLGSWGRICAKAPGCEQGVPTKYPPHSNKIRVPFLALSEV